MTPSFEPFAALSTPLVFDAALRLGVPALFGRLTCPMTGISIDDDRYAPRAAVDALYRIYANARVERLHLVPREHGLEAIGHFGPFRRQFRDTLWPLLVAPLEEAIAGAGRAA